MAEIILENDHKIGIEEIDDQHKQLAALLNELYRVMSVTQHFEEIEDIVTKIMNYAHLHNHTEEQLFMKYNYPGKLVHIQAHRSFMDRMAVAGKEYETAFKDGDGNIGSATVKIWWTIKTWYEEHILNEDKAFGEWVQRQES